MRSRNAALMRALQIRAMQNRGRQMGLNILARAFLISLALSATALAATPPRNAAVAIAVDASADLHPINPKIYGVAFASSDDLKALNAPLNRMGGNAMTTYNWWLNAENLAADWYFESYPQESSTPGEQADTFISESKTGGAEPMVPAHLGQCD